jgi:hypothetical protein
VVQAQPPLLLVPQEEKPRGLLKQRALQLPERLEL